MHSDSLHLLAAQAEPWQARLSLGFAMDAGTTRLVERSHFGPLRLQKALYPEGPRICHGIVVHPPGGVVGGDRLQIAASVGTGGHAFLTSPGAAKWYKANGRVSGQQLTVTVEQGGVLEWLPQETILFDEADVELEQSISLAADASFIGWDILCFGRTASGEAFRQGRLRQRTAIRRDGRLVWHEQGTLEAGGAMMQSPLGLHGHTVCATLIAVGKVLPPAVLGALRDAARQAAQGKGRFGATQMKSVLVARYLGDASETAKAVMAAAWSELRPALTSHAVVLPRIWNT